MMNLHQCHKAVNRTLSTAVLLLAACLSHAEVVSGTAAAQIESVSGTAAAQIESVAYNYVVETIAQQVKDFSRFDVEVRKLDPHLQLSPCEDLPIAESTGSGRLVGSVVLRVSCQKPSPWRIHVPVTIRLYKNVVVATDRLPRSTLLSSSHVMLSERDVSRIHPSFLVSTADALGKSMKRSVRSGTVITHGMLQEQDLIKRGDSVIIVASKKGLSVRMPGVALMNGSLGKQIKVRNEQSQRIVKGWISAAGEIRVPM